MKKIKYGAPSFEARSKTVPAGIHHIDAEAGLPASACQTSASVGVKLNNSESYDHVPKH